MAFYYSFKPNLSFIGKWWWHIDGAYIHPFEWRESAHLLKPIWVRFESGDGEDGYLRVESEEGSLKPASPLLTVAPGVLYDTFWFGAYEKNGKYYFQIRPIAPDIESEPALTQWYLDTDMVGYMGMYYSWSEVPEWVLYLGEDLWQLRAFDLHDVIEGERLMNLEFADSDDNPVTLRKQSGRPYLYTGSRLTAGRVSVTVLKRPYPQLSADRKRP